MRKRLIAFFAFATIGCPQEDAVKQPPPTPAPQPVVQPQPVTQQQGGDGGAGKRLYLTACANCHGPDGTGSMMRQALPKIGDLTSPEVHARMKDEDIITLIKTGRDKMPAFGDMFGPDQLQALIGYVRTLKRAQ